MVGEAGLAVRSSGRKQVWRQGWLCVHVLCIGALSGCGHLRWASQPNVRGRGTSMKVQTEL